MTSGPVPTLVNGGATEVATPAAGVLTANATCDTNSWVGGWMGRNLSMLATSDKKRSLLALPRQSLTVSFVSERF